MPKKILIVDDEIHIRVLLEQMLEDFKAAGVEILSACDGLEAWNVVRREQPQIVILDVMMPNLSGYEVCQRIKNDPILSHAHVIMLTAKGQRADRQRSVAVGANEYITKPFDPNYVIDRISNILGISV